MTRAEVAALPPIVQPEVEHDWFAYLTRCVVTATVLLVIFAYLLIPGLQKHYAHLEYTNHRPQPISTEEKVDR